MNQQRIRYFGILAIALIAFACGPTDEGIIKAVKAKLATDETAKAAQIDVAVQKKVVTLSGTVDTPLVKERAVAVARGTNGVAEVVDQITVKEQNAGPGLSPGRGPGSGHGNEMTGKGMPEDMNHPIEENRK